jgi:hypothetical protein
MAAVKIRFMQSSGVKNDGIERPQYFSFAAPE